MDFLTLVFLIVAVVIFFRLRSVLGSRNGHERSPLEKKWQASTLVDFKKLEPPTENKAALLAPPPAVESKQDSQTPLALALKAISVADPKFDTARFLKGAKIAYEVILTAFAANERDKLRPLLSSELFDHFDEEISAREKKSESIEFHFIGITSADITEAKLKGDIAQIGVHFNAKLVQATRNAEGAITEGSATTIAEVGDSWMFERKISSPDPNWKLVATEHA